MKRSSGSVGFSLIETLVAMSILSVMLALGVFWWQGRLNQNALRYGTFQVASDIRLAQEMAKSGRYCYTTTFAAGASSYTVTSNSPYSKTIQLPSGVTTNAVSVIFSGFGQPVTACAATSNVAYTVNVQNSVGTGTVTVDIMGGISYQLP